MSNEIENVKTDLVAMPRLNELAPDFNAPTTAGTFDEAKERMESSEYKCTDFYFCQKTL